MKKSTRGIKLGTRPHQWKSGPAEEDHASYYAWLQCRNQARYRSEGWDLTFEQWLDVWTGLWHRRGRAGEQLCITRKNCDLPWTLSNVIVITRRQHGQRKAGQRLSLGQGPRDRVIPDDWAAKP